MVLSHQKISVPMQMDRAGTYVHKKLMELYVPVF